MVTVIDYGNRIRVEYANFVWDFNPQQARQLRNELVEAMDQYDRMFLAEEVTICPTTR